ncbi:hypothetical protein ACFQT0_27290 [Hymenobacter humi]|uniref:Polymerase/histidinol phosphatase N-terminal domain-containing protein n=1 Tax=Hymenobacter humi TaxID=1411620 RepID=A0ABW2UAV6_9BACT
MDSNSNYNVVLQIVRNTTYTVPVPPVGTLLPFRGNIHAHSSYSDGNQDGLATTPLQDFQYAAASLHSDFLGISEHNHSQAGMSLPNFARACSRPTWRQRPALWPCTAWSGASSPAGATW